MKSKKLKFSAILVLGLGLTGLQAQEVIQASGGEASGSEGSASYSIGQVFYTTNTGTEAYSIAEGVQQPYEISVVIGIEQAKGINLECLAYPNPTTDFLTLKVENYDFENLLYRLYDMNGKLLENKKLTSNKTTIQMENLVTSTYFLKVIQGKKELKTFRIVKN